MITVNGRTAICADRIVLVVLVVALAVSKGQCQEPIQNSREYKLIEEAFKLRIVKERPAKPKEPVIQLAPDKLVQAMITYVRLNRDELVRRELAALFVLIGMAGLIDKTDPYLGRVELVKYLELDDRGKLKVDGAFDADSTVAYHLLYLLDRPHSLPQGRSGLEPTFFTPAESREEQYAVLAPLEPIHDAYKFYPKIIESYGDKVPPALVEYLFSEFPVAAWRYFALARNDKTTLAPEEFIWSVHVLATTVWRRYHKGRDKYAEFDLAQKELQKLVDDTAWYSRRFAVQVLLSYPFFRTPELVKKLQNDPHPLVRERAKHIKLDPAQQK